MYMDLYEIDVENETKQNIKDCIKVILSTSLNERIMLSEFGCNLKQYVFEVMNEATFARMRKDIIYSLNRWEYRIHDIEVDFYPKSDGVLECLLTYKIDDDVDSLSYVISGQVYE